MAVSLMSMIAIMARTHGFGRDQNFYGPVLFSTFKCAFLSLLTSVIIVGGILLSGFIPTEAAVAARAWALFLGILVCRTLTIPGFPPVSFDTIGTTAVGDPDCDDLILLAVGCIMEPVAAITILVPVMLPTLI